MGRHSRPEDLEESGEPDDASGVVEVDDDAGRHLATADTGPVPVVREPVARKGSHGTAADLRLIRERADVRNRCIAAVLVPFIVYSVALLLAGAISAYLIWIFAPTILAGLLVGATLDHAHKRYPEG